MSCEIRLIGNIGDIPAIRRYLFPTDDARGSDGWLQLCKLSVAPTADVIALAHERRLMILSNKEDDALSNQFQITYSGALHPVDNIKAIMCLPVVNAQKTTLHDWTCIVVGFESGMIHFYNESGMLLLTELLHNETVIAIKCQSQHHPRPDLSPDLHQEEVHVQYQSTLCIIPGSHLFGVLRNCLYEMAQDRRSEPLHGMIQPKKWGFQDQTAIHDIAVVGINLHSTFDHLLTVSTCGGFDAKYRSSAPYNSLVLAAGSRPFLGFHYALEGCAQPVFSDVAKAVATKLKSALPSWLVGGNSKNLSNDTRETSIAMQPSDLMGCRFGLCDLLRTGSTIVMSPDHRLAALADCLGRVLLVDTYRGCVLRMFKGYRDAQCAFVQVPDERHSKHRIGNKVAVFLVIYAAKKGTIELFTVQQGAKLATFTASKYSRLVTINYSLMGFTSTSKSKFLCQFTTLFVDNDGGIKEILIPFHFALGEKNNKRARDIYLYKKLRKFLKYYHHDDENNDLDILLNDTYSIYSELRTIEVQLQAVELLLSNKNLPVEVHLKCVQYFNNYNETATTTNNPDNNDDDDDNESINNNSSELSNNKLKRLTENAELLLNFYVIISNSSRKNNDDDTRDDQQNDDKIIKAKLFFLGSKDLQNLQTLLDLNTLNVKSSGATKIVAFSDLKQELISSAEFLSVFNLLESVNKTIVRNICLKQNIEDNDELIPYQIGQFIFRQFIERNDHHQVLPNLEKETTNSNLSAKDLFLLLINYWINRPLNNNINLEIEMNNFASTIYSLIKTADDNDDDNIDIRTDYNSISKFWTMIRQILAKSSKPFPALIAAILCKNIVQQIENNIELSLSTADDDNNIIVPDSDDSVEILSQESIEWSILIGKLEDVSLLNILLVNNNPIANDCTLPKLLRGDDQKKINISLEYILSRGKGSVSELIAQWLGLCGVNPDNIILNERIYRKLHNDDDNDEDKDCSSSSSDEDALPDQNEIEPQQIDRIKSEPVFNYLDLIRAQFPYSLNSSRLMSNMCWEYALMWQKNIQELSVLDASLKCLNLIPNSYIKRGLYYLVWNTHIKIIFESTCKLINKVGKLPKDRLCKQDTGLSDNQINRFLEITTNFFDGYMIVVQQCCCGESTKSSSLKYEQLWDDNDDDNSYQIALVELALQQNEINYDLLQLHYQLSLMLQMLTQFPSIKYPKPVTSLFDSYQISLLFIDLQKSNTKICWEQNDFKVQSCRVQFLYRIILASLETVTVSDANVYYTSVHVKYMKYCLLIGALWNIKSDLLRRYQIVHAYRHGFDVLGDELFGGIDGRVELGPELLAIAAKRLSLFLDKSPNYCQNVAVLSTAVTGYIRSLNDEWCAPSTLKGIENLAIRSLVCLNENHSDYRLGEMLLEGCQSLIDLYKTDNTS